MDRIKSPRALTLLFVLTGITGALPAEAAYEYTSVDYPGATLTQILGSNESGKYIGDAMVGSTQIPFEYDARTRSFTPLPNAPDAQTTSTTAINNAGVIVGSAGNGVNDDRAIILDKGAFTFFANPGWALTQARGVSANGRLVTGYSFDSTATNYVGFIYDVAHGVFKNFLPSSFTIAEGINGRGDVVGNVTLSDSYGFLRQSNGTFLLFGVTGGNTVRARGINNSGLITGFFYDDASGVQKGFVARLAAGQSFQTLTLAADDLLEVPGASRTVAETINDSGAVGGVWIDAAGNNHGFVATPVQGAK